MEKLLLVLVKEKARIIYCDLKKQARSTSAEATEDTFKASDGWFDNFKKRSGIHSVIRHGEATSTAAEDYVTRFGLLIDKTASPNKSPTVTKRDYFGRKCHVRHSSLQRRSWQAINL